MHETTQTALRPRLFVNCVANLDWLIALEFGRVDEGQPADAWTGISEQFGYLFDGDRCVGFKVLGLAGFDLDAPEHEPIWGGPRFDAPSLALANASAGEVILAARVHFDGRPSINRLYFNEAVGAEDKNDALADWMSCVETGDSMAHYGLGVELFDAGLTARAYTHLRFYATIAPHLAWAQYWYARAAFAIEERAEASAAVDRVFELDPDENLLRLAVRLRAEIADS